MAFSDLRRAGICFLWIFMLLGFAVFFPQDVRALCATVKIEIRQELTLERQAFDAHMRINNGLAHMPIENVAVDVNFTDEKGTPVQASSDPNHTSARFFIRIDTMRNISNVSGSGSVAPETSADIHWLIIPAPGASNGRESGTLYFVGATLSYTAGGKSETIEVTPDYIFVKPMPELILDYFLPTDVYGDDPWTNTVEEPVPFELGLRILNRGHGEARSLKVESAQPRIIENEQGLLVGFNIEGVRVNGEPAQNSLLADFGDIASRKAGVARWIMTSSLSGRMVGFDAEFSHADALGGQMTSLIQEVNTRFLVRSVFVDAPGRDSIEDFLAKDDDVYRVYESDGTETLVTDQSEDASLVVSGNTWRFTVPPTAGFMYAALPDPSRGSLVIQGAVRSDGKRIRPENIWFSKTRAGSGPWQHSIHIFDHNTTGVYTLILESPDNLPRPPEIRFIPDRSGEEGRQLSFLVEASSPSGKSLALRNDALPVGAGFTDMGDGSGIFDWTPGPGQAGAYTLRFIASDGVLTASRQARIRIAAEGNVDTDKDGMPDAWELEHFGTLDRDGRGDFDGDGISDLDEYLNGFDPTVPQNVPGIPEILSPFQGEVLDTLRPVLVIERSLDPEKDPVTYTFEVFSDITFRERLFVKDMACFGEDTTSFMLPRDLEDKKAYYWRVRAWDHTGSSLWAHGHFVVHTEGGVLPEPVPADPVEGPVPGPVLKNPGQGAWVSGAVPVLSVHPALNPAQDAGVFQYCFEVYEDPALTRLVVRGTSAHPVFDDYQSLVSSRWYYWRVQALKDNGLAGAWSETGRFFAKVHALPPPSLSFVYPDAPLYLSAQGLTLRWLLKDTGPDATLALYYTDAPRTEGGTLIQGRLEDDSDGRAGFYTWDVSDLEGVYYVYALLEDGSVRQRVLCPFAITVDQTPPLVSATPPGGRFADTLRVELSANEPADIYYTLDGTLPSEASLPYTEPLVFDETRTLRFIAVDRAGNLSAPVTETYTKGAEVFRITVDASMGGPLGGLEVKAFNEAGDFTGIRALTCENGQADFDVSAFAPGQYLFRVSWMGRDYGTGLLDIPGSSAGHLSIAEEEVRVRVHTKDGAVRDVEVHLFSGSGASMGQYGVTDAGGEVVFVLPVGGEFTFRADLYGNPIWTGIVAVSGDGPNLVSVPTKGSSLIFHVSKGPEAPLEGVRIEIHDPSGALGLSAETDAEGLVAFGLPAGEYEAEIFWLGHSLWSDEIYLSADTRMEILLPHQTVSVWLGARYREENTALAGLPVHLFTDRGESVGLTQETNGEGYAFFEVPEQPYGARVTHRGQTFASSLFIWEDTRILVPMAEVRVRVQAGGQPLSNVMISLFDEADQPLDLVFHTDDGGEGSIRLPEGRYRFRADYLGNAFWSGIESLHADSVHTVHLGVGNEAFAFRVEKAEGKPIAGVLCRLFDIHDKDLGISVSTDAQGMARLDLPHGRYRIQAEYLGHGFWSEELKIPAMETATLQIPHIPVDVRVFTMEAGTKKVPAGNVRVQLYGDDDRYLELFRSTDAQGLARFLLPAGGRYRFQAGILTRPFWSSMLEVPGSGKAEADINGGGGRLNVRVEDLSGNSIAGIYVYLHRDDQLYLGQRRFTTHRNPASFVLPEGTYRLRLEYRGYRHWTEPVFVTGDTDFVLPLDLAACFIQQLTGRGFP
ncbi:chitobiase/beta-hexosaminidase-like protein [Desulfobotulus alkaliphilus]|uniref:Chitobiase/beta-hexosaminidase-like protein n=2 Tax=Desulfobotulus alkaliphilus TaxID=622671 RepID=A0A562R921_9BACT|nr:chitobiase/beta-hexosaminidase-like protein [Desulfobotulus alkaliphilus]